jgi:NitT/TauT family transport system substrate-binding protein
MSLAGSNFARMRASMAIVAGILSATVWSATALGADKITFLTSWFAQAEHGGFYQAKATGLYEKAGLDVTLKMGGPQVNGAQLLLAGETDFMMGYDLQVLKMLEQGLPVITVATSFQFDLQGIMAHDNVASLGDLKDKTILVATPGRTTWWPWLKAKFQYTDEQTRPYTFNLQPFFADKNVVQQSYPSSEPFQAKQQGVPVSSSCSRATAIRPTARPWSRPAASSTRIRGRRRASSRRRSRDGKAIWPTRRREMR